MWRVIQKCKSLYKSLGVDINDLETSELIEYLESLIEDLKLKPYSLPEVITIIKLPNRSSLRSYIRT